MDDHDCLLKPIVTRGSPTPMARVSPRNPCGHDILRSVCKSWRILLPENSSGQGNCCMSATHKVPPWCINLRVCSQPVEVMIQIHPLTIKLYNKQSPLLVGKYSINLQNCNISPTVKSASLGELPLNPTQPFYHVTLQ